MRLDRRVPLIDALPADLLDQPLDRVVGGSVTTPTRATRATEAAETTTRAAAPTRATTTRAVVTTEATRLGSPVATPSRRSTGRRWSSSVSAVPQAELSAMVPM